jgi:hypothetical protein
MIPQRFARSNVVMLALKGMTNCVDVHACQATWNGRPVVITCWRPTAEELVRINLGEPIWLSVVGQTMPPVLVTAEDPFVEGDKT